MQATTFEPIDAAEIVYVNGGEIYKAPSSKELFDRYPMDDNAHPIFGFSKVDGKRYYIFEQYRAHFGNVGFGLPMDGYDFCPDVTLWVGVATNSLENKQDFDIYFNVDSSAQLRAIAAYYGLPYPVDDRVAHIIDTARETVCFQNASGTSVVLGAVKYVSGVASILKLYLHPKPFGSWDVWMYGVSYYNEGQPFERGAVYTKLTGGADIAGANMRGDFSFRKAELIETERVDGVKTRYMYTRGKDKFMIWEGHELNPDGSLARIKHYESSQAVRVMIGRWKVGPTFAEHDLGAATPFWLGRAYYDDKDEQELLFAVLGGSAQLDKLAAHYGLPVPYNDEIKAILDSTPEVYRARHYDVLGLGEGNFVPVVVGSVTLVNGEPVRLLLYTLMRQWDFEHRIFLPDFQMS